jgi:hypothetical protein
VRRFTWKPWSRDPALLAADALCAKGRIRLGDGKGSILLPRMAPGEKRTTVELGSTVQLFQFSLQLLSSSILAIGVGTRIHTVPTLAVGYRTRMYSPFPAAMPPRMRIDPLPTLSRGAS